MTYNNRNLLGQYIIKRFFGCKAQKIDLRTIVNCSSSTELGTKYNQHYTIIPATPATGILYITKNCSFISGQVRMRGRNQGRYPFKYLEMLDNIFGYEPNSIEVCSYSVPGRNQGSTCFTIDINPGCNPDFVTNAETLKGVPSNEFDRWRCDPPYTEKTAKKMYNISMPNIRKLIESGMRVCRPKSLMFLLLGSQNYQWCPPGIKRIGWVAITIVPNNELRALHIFYKLDDVAS